MINPEAGDFNKDLVLRWFMFHLRMEDRTRLINALPEAYNDVYGRKIATVVRTENLPSAIPFE